MPAGVSGEKALAMFNSDSYDSDGDGVSNLIERAFGGGSLGQDSREAKPAPIDKNDGNQYLGFNRYNSTYQADIASSTSLNKARTCAPGRMSPMFLATSTPPPISAGVWNAWFIKPQTQIHTIRVRVKAK